MYDWLAGGAAVLGLCSVLLLVLRVPTPAVLSWLATTGAGGDDETLTAVGGVLTRMAYVGAVVFFLGTVAGLMLQLKAVSAATALAFAVVASANVRVDGGSRRRAQLETSPVPAGRGRRDMVIATAVGVLTAVVSGVLALVNLRRSSPHGSVSLHWGTVLPDVEYYSLPVLAALSVLLSVTGWWGVRRIRRRQSLAVGSTDADSALRQASARRITIGMLGGQIILLGAALRGVPLLAPTVGEPLGPWEPSPDLTVTAGVLALAVIVVGLAVLVYALATPLWSGLLHRRTANPENRGG